MGHLAALAACGLAAATSLAANPVVLGRARFTVIAPECIRLEDDPRGEFTDDPSLVAINRAARFNGFSLTLTATSVEIDTGRMVLRYRADGAAFSPANCSARIRSGDSWAAWDPATPDPGNLGGTFSTLDGLAGPADPGTGLLSRTGWFLLNDSRRPLLRDGWVVPRPREGVTDWYLFGYGLDFRAALSAFTTLAGAVPLPRKAELGAWYSRYWPYSSEDYRGIVGEFEAHGFPLDVLVFDMDWHRQGWTGWSWNRTLLPDAEQLLGWLHDHGLAVTLNLHPASGVAAHEDRYPAFMKAIGRDPLSRETVPFDAADRGQMEALTREVLAPLEHDGVDFWWLDWQQEENTRGLPGLRNLWWLNHVLFTHAETNGRRGALLSRWGGWGDHRHPVHFSGDTDSGWPMLRFEVPFTSTAGNVGCFFWSHDIGGHMGARNEESFVRWTQFGAVSAALRLHSGRRADLDRRPWTWSPRAEAAMRGAFALRGRLFPYIYSAAWQSHDRSIPLVRPMYLDFPDADEAYRNPQQYLFGDAVLAAPVTSPGAGEGQVARQTVWFPAGRWVHWFSGERVEGPAERLIPSTLDEFPLYVRAGVPIPLQPPTRRMATTPLTTLIVRCEAAADGARGAATLYEDDGESDGYLNGKFALTPLTYERTGDAHRITVGPASGGYPGQPAARAIEVELGGVSGSVTVEVDGKPAAAVIDEATGTVRVTRPARPPREPLTVTIHAAEEDPALRTATAQRRRLGAVLGRTITGDPRDALLAALARPSATPADVLAAAGIGWVNKPESPTGYGGRARLHLYDGAGWVDRGALRMRVTDAGAGGEHVIEDAVHAVTPGHPVRLESVYPPLPEPAAVGRPATRRITVSCAIRGRRVTSVMEAGRRASCLTRWLALGPFAFDPHEPLAGQHPLASTSWINVGATARDAEGALTRWRKMKCGADHVVDLHQVANADDRLAYAATWLTSPREQPVTFSVNSDDGIELWLNGTVILNRDLLREMTDAPDVVQARLRAGRNLLLAKVSQGTGEWAFRIEAETPRALHEAWPEAAPAGKPAAPKRAPKPAGKSKTPAATVGR